MITGRAVVTDELANPKTSLPRTASWDAYADASSNCEKSADVPATDLMPNSPGTHEPCNHLEFVAYCPSIRSVEI